MTRVFTGPFRLVSPAELVTLRLAACTAFETVQSRYARSLYASACTPYSIQTMTILRENSPGFERLREMLAASHRTVVFTGAGISTESGIPDFRSPGGIWAKYRPIVFEEFMASEQARREYWRRKFATHEAVAGAQPNQGTPPSQSSLGEARSPP